MLHTQEKGLSMIEMLGVLAIIGVLSVGGLAGYNMAMGRVRVNRVIDELQLVAVNIRTAVPNGVYNDIATIADNMGILVTLNENLKALGAGASADVAETKTSGGSAKDRFDIVFTKLPLDACRRIAGLDWGTDSGVSKVAGGDSGVSTSGQGAVDKTGTSLAIAECGNDDPIETFVLHLK